MRDFRSKIIDLNKEFSFPVRTAFNNHFQAVESYSYLYPHHVYELENVKGESFSTFLARFDVNLDLFEIISSINKLLKWYELNCFCRLLMSALRLFLSLIHI